MINIYWCNSFVRTLVYNLLYVDLYSSVVLYRLNDFFDNNFIKQADPSHNCVDNRAKCI